MNDDLYNDPIDRITEGLKALEGLSHAHTLNIPQAKKFMAAYETIKRILAVEAPGATFKLDTDAIGKRHGEIWIECTEFSVTSADIREFLDAIDECSDINIYPMENEMLSVVIRFPDVFLIESVMDD